MKAQLVGANEWWENLTPTERPFFRDLIRLAEDLLDEEVLRMRFDGRNISLVLVSDRRKATDLGRLGGMRSVSPAPEPEEWWAGLPAQARVFVRALDEVIGRLVRYQDELLEIYNTGNGFLARQSVEFRHPAGQAELN